MFKLVKILGGRINVPEVRTISVKAAAAATYAAGTPVSVSASGIAKLSSSTTTYASYIIAEDVTFSGTTTKQDVKVYDILPGMVFETKLSAALTLANGNVGTQFQIDSTGTKMTATAADPSAQSGAARGVILFEQFGTASGDKVHVTFPFI